MSENEKPKVRHYADERIDVSYDASRCIHAAECVHRLPAVFDTTRRPWILPSGGDAEAIATVVTQCPTGALHFTRLDGGPAEATPDRNVIVPMPNGPLHVHGQLQLRSAEHAVTLDDVRIALCRCGQSRNKPFCDNSHRDAGFKDRGVLPDDVATPVTAAAATATSATTAGDAADAAIAAITTDGTLTIKPAPNGPLLVEGTFTIRTRNGRMEHRAVRATLCRCGASDRKPFCDGSHRRIGFISTPAIDQRSEA